MPGSSVNRLPAGFVLTITASATSSGFYRQLEDPGAAAAYAGVACGASSTTTVGPFTTGRNYEVVSLVGDLSYAITQADYGTSGTGDALRATAATVSAPLITPPVTLASASGAVTVSPGTVKITKAGVAALTLAAPTTAQEGIEIEFTSATANAHTLTATGLLNDGVTGGAKDLATFAAFVGASITLKAVALKWNVISLNAVLIS
jgi:hypothetical protein